MIEYARHRISLRDLLFTVRALCSRYITQGPWVEKFEGLVCEKTGAPAAVAVSSATSGLMLVIKSLDLPAGFEAITTPVTFAATVNAVIHAGGTPVFVDIDPETGLIREDLIEKAITEKTKLLLPVHLAGQPCDMFEIYRIAKKYNLFVIEDAAHAFGAEYMANKKWYRMGECAHSNAAVFSLHAAKNITCGEGGVITVKSRRLAQRLRRLRHHGIKKGKFWRYSVVEPGFNARITDFQCALAYSQLLRLDKINRRRAELACVYDEIFSNSKKIKPLKKIAGRRSAWHLYIVRIPKRDFVYNFLLKHGVKCQVHYKPLHLHPAYKKNVKIFGKLSGAELYFKTALTLPLYPQLSKSAVKKIALLVLKGLNST